MKGVTRKRIGYAVAFVVMVAVEVLIALYVHDDFIRPYFGDMLVVCALYALVRIFVPDGVKMLPLYIFLFAVCVEISQYLHIADLLGISRNPFLRVLVGGVFDWKDIACYAVGCVLLGVTEWVRWRKDRHADSAVGGDE